jgi:DNA-dependent RNA polymerase auxiliary subunit epsilon
MHSSTSFLVGSFLSAVLPQFHSFFGLFPFLAHSIYIVYFHTTIPQTPKTEKPTHIYVNSKNAATIRNSLTDTFPFPTKKVSTSSILHAL